MLIKSNTRGKLEKILNGDVFDDPMVFVTELFQNSYRAKATEVTIHIGENVVIFSDNGVGCKKPDNILTLDYSDWESTDEGFGIGFWSVLGIPEIKTVSLLSHNWIAEINVEDLLDNLEAKVEKFEEKRKGFIVKLFSPYFQENQQELMRRIIVDSQTLPFRVIMNGVELPKKDLFKEVDGDFTMEFSNRLFDAKFAISEKSWSNPALYYEKRLVTDFHWVEGVKGVIEMKSKTLNLKEPDRKSVVYNDKFYKFKKKVNECIKELYIEFLKQAPPALLNQYARVIDSVLGVDDYEKWITVEGFEFYLDNETRNIPVSQDSPITRLQNFIEQKRIEAEYQQGYLTLDDKQQKFVSTLLNEASDGCQWVSTGEVEPETVEEDFDPTTDDLSQMDKVVVNGIVFKKEKVDIEFFTQDDEESVSTITITTQKKKKKTGNIKDAIKAFSKRVWMKADELFELSDLKAKAEYYGVKVFIARNVLHERIYEKNNVAHISQIESGVTKRFIKKDVELRSKKEEAYIALLQPVCQYYDLPLNTFLIGRLKMLIETTLDGRVIDRQVDENKNGEVKVYAVCEGRQIIFDRKALGLQRFHLYGDGIGQHEYKALLATLPTVAHELAHLLYETEDNTTEHFKKENEIYDELVNLYLAF